MVDVLGTTADNMANDLFTALTDGVNFTSPTLDLSGDDFAIPPETDNALFESVTSLTEADLTSRMVGGSGLFDGLMEAMADQLRGEYDRGRITGKEYATAYIALTTQALGTASQYLLGREQTHWQAMLAQQQARAAEIGVVQERVKLEIAKFQAIQAQMDANTSAANFALTKAKLATEQANFELATKQLDKLTKEIAILDYQLSDILPKEAARIQGQTDHTTAQKDQVLYQTASILPAQKLNIEADTSGKTYQATTLMPTQVEELGIDILTKTYQKDFILPEQLENIREQVEAVRAKTLDTRRDGVTTIEGAIGKQKDLQDQQITSYQRDAEAKLLKMYLDTYATESTLVDGAGVPTSMDAADIDALLTQLKTNLNLT